MRFIYRLLEIMPTTEHSLVSTHSLRFILIKQMISLLESLKVAL